MLAACQSNPPPVSWPIPASGQWASAFGQYSTPYLGLSFDIPGGQGLHYVYTAAPANLGTAVSITLDYTIDGNATFGINDPSDGPPPQITLFIWEAGDNLTCDGSFANDRVFSHQRSPVANGTYAFTISLDQSFWSNCYGQQTGLAQALSNPAFVGFTFGGNSFDGHGVYVASGSATFTINSFTVQ